MAPQRPEKVQTTMRIQGDVMEAVRAEAAKTGLSRTALIEQILAKFLRPKGYKIDVRVTV